MTPRMLCLAAAAFTFPLAAPAFAQDANAPAAAAAQARNYSVETTPVGTLLDDPEAAAILQRLIPAVYANEMFQSMGRPNTLRFIQQYEPATLTNAKLAEIQAEFDKLNG